MFSILLLFFILHTIQVSANPDGVERLSGHKSHIEEVVNKSVVIRPDTVGGRKFFLDGFVTSAKDVLVYMNGVPLASRYYKVYPNHNLIILNDSLAIPDSALFTCDYIARQEHFVLAPTFNGLKFASIPTAGKRVQYDLDGIDENASGNNDYRLTAHGFRPMSFILEGYSANTSDRIVADRVELDGYVIELVDNPSNVSSEKVLRFKHGTINDSNNRAQRIEGNVSRHIKANKVVSEVELYIPSTIKGKKFKSKPVDWFTIQEYWCGRTTVETERRLTVSLNKRPGDESLFFNLSADNINLRTGDATPSEKYRIADYSLDFDRWIYLRVEIEPGNDKVGKIRIVIRPEGGKEFFFEQTLSTVYPVFDYCSSPRPVYEDFSVMKLYTSTAYVRNGTFSSEEDGTVSNVEIFFRNCRVDCIRAVYE